MDCKEVQDQLLEYIEGSMDEKEKRLIEEHCENCTDCLREIEELREAISYIQYNSQRIVAPESLIEGGEAKGIEKGAKKGRKRLASGALVAALVTLFVVTAFAMDGFNVIEWWKNKSIQESESIEELIAKGYGQKLNLVQEDQNVKITVESVIADEVNTLLLVEIEDLKGEKKYELNPREGGVVARGNFYFDEYTSPRRGESRLGGGHIFYTPEKNRMRKIITLDPIAGEEEVIDLIINELEELDRERGKILEGNWSFQIPVKKYEAYTYNVNQEMNLDGNTILFEEMVVAPTVTVLTYSYKSNQNRAYTIDYIRGIRILGKGKEYNYSSRGTPVSYIDSSGLRRQTITFDSMYFDDPEEIKIQVEGYEVTVKQYGKLDLDLEKSFPQTFEYMGSPITIEKVEIGKESARILMIDHIENRKYERLAFEAKVLKNSFTRTTYDIDGHILDEKGRKIEPGTSNIYVNQKGKPKFYVTSYDISVINADFAREYVDKIEGATLEVIPWRIQIKGYYETRFVEKEMTVKLK